MAIRQAQLEQWADEADQRYGFDPGQMRRLIRQESGWNPAAVSPAGARGLTQFMPATAQEWGVDFSNPRSQIDKGAEYLAHLRDRYGGDMRKALAAYNWGMGNVERQGLQNMPQETRDYLHATYAGPGIPRATAPTPQPQAQPQQPQPQQQPRSLDDILMAELTRQPEQRQNNVFDFMGQIAPLVAASMGNPQMIGVTSMVAQQLANMRQQEADQEEARQDRLLQLAVLRGKDTRTPKQRDIEYFMQNPQAAQMEMQLRQASAPPSYGLATNPQTGAMYQYSRTSPEVTQVSPGVDPREAAEAEANQRARIERERLEARELSELEPQMPGTLRDIEKLNTLKQDLESGKAKLPSTSLLMRAIDPDRGFLTNVAIENAPPEYREAIQAIGPIAIESATKIARENNPTGPVSDSDVRMALTQVLGQIAGDPAGFIDSRVAGLTDRVNRYQQLGGAATQQVIPGSSTAQGGGTPITPETQSALQGGLSELNQLLQGMQ